MIFFMITLTSPICNGVSRLVNLLPMLFYQPPMNGLFTLRMGLKYRDVKVIIKITNMPLKKFANNRKKGTRPIIAGI